MARRRRHRKLEDGWDEAELRVERAAGPHGDFMARRGLLSLENIEHERRVVKRLRLREQKGDRWNANPRTPTTSPSPSLRRQVYERDGYQCVLCGTSDDLSLDHWIPRCKGGTNTLDNLRTMCKPCNNAKGAKHPRELVGATA